MNVSEAANEQAEESEVASFKKFKQESDVNRAIKEATIGANEEKITRLEGDLQNRDEFRCTSGGRSRNYRYQRFHRGW